MLLPRGLTARTMQAVATFTACLLYTNFGYMFGLTPPHMRLYMSDETPLDERVNFANATWVSGYIFLCASVGSLFFGLVASQVGPQKMLLVSAGLQIFSWCMLYFGSDISHVHSSRVFTGISGGAITTIIPLYVEEICQSKNFMRLSVYFPFSLTVSFLYGTVFGQYFYYSWSCLIGLLLSITFFITFAFVRESPYHFVRAKNVTNLEKSLRWFRGLRETIDGETCKRDSEFIGEYNELISHALAMKRLKMTFTVKLNFWLLSFLLATCQHMCGLFVFLNYASDILKKFNVASADAFVMYLSIMQIIGSGIAYYIITKFSKRYILFAGSACTCLTLIGLLVFMEYVDTDNNVWIVPLLLSFHILFTNATIYPIVPLFILKVLPPGYHYTVSCLAYSFSWLVLVVVMQNFRLKNMKIPLIIFIISCIILCVMALFFLPKKISADPLLKYLNKSARAIEMGDIRRYSRSPRIMDYKIRQLQSREEQDSDEKEEEQKPKSEENIKS